jgi:hypothetical protein
VLDGNLPLNAPRKTDDYQWAGDEVFLFPGYVIAGVGEAVLLTTTVIINVSVAGEKREAASGAVAHMDAD